LETREVFISQELNGLNCQQLNLIILRDKIKKIKLEMKDFVILLRQTGIFLNCICVDKYLSKDQTILGQLGLNK